MRKKHEDGRRGRVLGARCIHEDERGQRELPGDAWIRRRPPQRETVRPGPVPLVRVPDFRSPPLGVALTDRIDRPADGAALSELDALTHRSRERLDRASVVAVAVAVAVEGWRP